jgi:hypothetical protein
MAVKTAAHPKFIPVSSSHALIRQEARGDEDLHMGRQFHIEGIGNGSDKLTRVAKRGTGSPPVNGPVEGAGAGAGTIRAERVVVELTRERKSTEEPVFELSDCTIRAI